MTTLLAVLLVVSVALNIYLWRRSRGGVPQEAIDRVHDLSATVQDRKAKLQAAEDANEPKP